MKNIDSRFKIICKVITGSKLYGTATPQSDTDIRGVFIPTSEFYFGFLNKVEQVESHVPDETFWEITKFFRLCLDNNPNIMELLFIPKDFIINKTEEWDKIIAHRDLFLSTKARHTFSGYAVSQLHRIKQHREWLLNPPKKQPERGDFNLPEVNVITRDQINAYDELLDREHKIVLPQDVLITLQREKAYINAMKYWDNYNRWKQERNKDRAELEAKFGYDTKHASHLFRLIGEGIELLTTSNITFPRPDKDELLAIRQGKYTYNELMSKLGDDVDTNFKTIEDTFVLPHKPKHEEVDKLCQELVKNRLGIK
jgi:uncharacterized protein